MAAMYSLASSTASAWLAQAINLDFATISSDLASPAGTNFNSSLSINEFMTSIVNVQREYLL